MLVNEYSEKAFTYNLQQICDLKSIRLLDLDYNSNYFITFGSNLLVGRWLCQKSTNYAKILEPTEIFLIRWQIWKKDA